MKLHLCTGCGTAFTPTDPRQQYCRKDCGRTSQESHAARTGLRRRHDVEFVAVDGEGITQNDHHQYVMLSIGDATLTDGGNELGPWQIFDHLWQHADEGDAMVGYYLGYDFTQWVRNLPEKVARELLTSEGISGRQRTKSGQNHVPFPVRWEQWEFDMLAERRFKLRPAGSKAPWLYVCDAGPFYQTSFLSAIDPEKWTTPVATPEELEVIREGKAQRADAEYNDAMRRYNVTENRVMARLMQTLNRGLVDMGVYLDRHQWFGPGQAAGEWMATAGAPDAATIHEVVPLAVLEAARASYYGGWFEITAHGRVGTLYEYDVNSAYPHAISRLPCLRHGTWRQTTRPRGVGLAYATVHGDSDIIGAMLHREPSGAIHRPRDTRGWFWVHELEAARRAGCVATVDVHDGWEYQPCECPPPLRGIADLYQHRLAMGKNTSAGIAAKLIYNSVYGKLAQSVGNPRWANPLYASMVTSLTRTAILDAIALTSHMNVAMVATDGLYTFEPLPLECSPSELGAWDGALKEDVTIQMPGMYWSADTRERIATGRSLKLKSRGVNAAALAAGIDNLEYQWATWKFGQPWPVVTVPVPFSMISARQALARGKWHLAGELVKDDTKTVSGNPQSKRRHDLPWSDSEHRIRTFCYDGGTSLESTPYDGTLGLPEDSMTPDGPASMLLGQLWR